MNFIDVSPHPIFGCHDSVNETQWAFVLIPYFAIWLIDSDGKRLVHNAWLWLEHPSLFRSAHFHFDTQSWLIIITLFLSFDMPLFLHGNCNRTLSPVCAAPRLCLTLWKEEFSTFTTHDTLAANGPSVESWHLRQVERNGLVYRYCMMTSLLIINTHRAHHLA